MSGSCGCKLPPRVYHWSGWHLERLNAESAFDALWRAELRGGGVPLVGDERERIRRSCEERAPGYVGVPIAVERCPEHSARRKAEREKRAAERVADQRQKEPRRGRGA